MAALLNIEAPPQSLKIIKCKSVSPLTTDTVITCGIKIKPKEFPLLLKGYNFEKRSPSQTSYTLSDYGLENFEITEGYHIEPEWFKYGGSIDIYTNRHYERVFVRYYRE